jgi:hypothetical protein
VVDVAVAVVAVTVVPVVVDVVQLPHKIGHRPLKLSPNSGLLHATSPNSSQSLGSTCPLHVGMVVAVVVFVAVVRVVVEVFVAVVAVLVVTVVCATHVLHKMGHRCPNKSPKTGASHWVASEGHSSGSKAPLQVWTVVAAAVDVVGGADVDALHASQSSGHASLMASPNISLTQIEAS